MLKELQQGVNKLKLFEGCVVNPDSKKELVTLWNERFQFIQVIPNAIHKLNYSVTDFHLCTDLFPYHGTCSKPKTCYSRPFIEVQLQCKFKLFDFYLM